MSHMSSGAKSIVRPDVLSDRAWHLDAMCINCHKRFKSIRAITMHLKLTGTRHSVKIIAHGNYNKRTGLRD